LVLVRALASILQSVFSGRFSAFLESGNLLGELVLGDGEVFGTKAGYIVPFAIRYRHIELYQINVYPETRWLVLSRGLWWSTQQQKQA
jgi:hypothetical protein